MDITGRGKGINKNVWFGEQKENDTGSARPCTLFRQVQGDCLVWDVNKKNTLILSYLILNIDLFHFCFL